MTEATANIDVIEVFCLFLDQDVVAEDFLVSKDLAVDKGANLLCQTFDLVRFIVNQLRAKPRLGVHAGPGATLSLFVEHLAGHKQKDAINVVILFIDILPF